MSKLTIMRGVSGSGKSTWARSQSNAVVVSRDDLRAALFGSSDQDYYAVDKAVLSSKEAVITHTQNAAIEGGLLAGKHVIVDNTHVEWKHVEETAAIGQKVGAEIEIKVFDVSMLKAQANNILRSAGGGRKVPNEVIARQYERLQFTKNKTVADLAASRT